MSSRDDSPTDMDSHDLSDEQAEALLAGTQAPHGFEGVAAEFSALRQLSSQPHDVAVSAPLGEFVTQPSTYRLCRCSFRQPCLQAPQGENQCLPD